MEKNIAGLIGAATALAMAGPAAAAPASQQDFVAAMAVSSYGDLLRPIPNAASLLRAASMTQPAPVSEEPVYGGEAKIETVQYHDHHHHHHHHHYRRHHRRVVIAVPTPVPHHHHHHHDSSVIIAPRL